MSVVELFVLRARLQGGILRGTLKLTLPIGFVYAETDMVVLDADLQVQATIREIFRDFAHTGSAFTTVRHFRQQHVLFPRRLRRGAHRGELVWAEIEHCPVYETQRQGEVLDRMDTKRKSDLPEFKRKVVLESMQRDTTQEAVCKKSGISSSMLHHWRKGFQ